MRNAMPVHIGELTSDVAVHEGEVPLTPAQLDKIVALVMKRIEAAKREAKQAKEVTSVRNGALPHSM
jgi:hypothetical protein